MNAAIEASALFGEKYGPVSGASITSVEYDSRKVVSGSCFVAVKGFNVDGHDFVADSARKGASVIVVEREVEGDFGSAKIIKVKDSRKELAVIADKFYGHPSAKLGLIGITGTNGKTTVSYMIEKMLSLAGYSASRLGTVNYNFPDGSLEALNTTPESADLQKLFARAASFENPRCVIEVSSHGLALGRLSQATFKGGIFTNLTQDHLDFHSSMEEYGEVKKKLFTAFDLEYSIINLDDPVGASLVSQGLPHKVFSYGFSSEADIRVLENRVGWDGNSLLIGTPKGDMRVDTPMPGRHNAYNALASVGLGLAEGIDFKIISEAIASVKSVPGRFETVKHDGGFAVVIDYAHTDNALKNVLQTAREITSGKVISVFGCGGDRDKGKRPLMGAVAAEYSDIAVVTSDNPRTEDPAAIIGEILDGMGRINKDALYVIESREKAIEKAIALAEQGDCVIIAGKGHENYQIVGSEKLHFDDREAAMKYLTGAN